MSLVDVERHEKSVALVRLGRPEALCVIDERHTADLLAAVEGVGRDPDVRAGVLTGQGRAFCAGGEDALAWGLVDQLVDDDRVHDAALALAARLADWPGEVAGAAKRLLDVSSTSTFETHLEEERVAVIAMGRTAAHREALAWFLHRS